VCVTDFILDEIGNKIGGSNSDTMALAALSHGLLTYNPSPTHGVCVPPWPQVIGRENLKKSLQIEDLGTG
jgi:hypothetical protein